VIYAPLTVTRLANSAPGLALWIIIAFPDATLTAGAARILLLALASVLAAILIWRGYRMSVVVNPDALRINGLLRDRLILREWLLSIDNAAVVNWQRGTHAPSRTRIYAFTVLRPPLLHRVSQHNEEVIARIRAAYDLSDARPESHGYAA